MKVSITFDVIKVAFSNPKKLAGNDVWVPKVLLMSSLNIEQSMFKLAMKSNACVVIAKPIDVNPLTHLWCIFLASRLLTCSFLEYVKLIEIAMVQVLGNVKDE
jgi:hypothetical protein